MSATVAPAASIGLAARPWFDEAGHGYVPDMDDDVVAVLNAEHGTLRELFRRVASPDEDRGQVLNTLMQTMTSHGEMEMQILAPVLKARVEGGDAMAERMGSEHDRIEHLLTLLERRKVNSPDVPGMVTELLNINDAHITDADTALLPGLRAALSDEELSDLGRRITSGQARQLTHSYPIVPGNGPIAGIAHKLAEIVDAIRARTERQGGTGR